MLSKEEFMQGYEAMFDRVKGPNGIISLKDMQMESMGMMGHKSMFGKDHQMPSAIKKGMK